ncbi:MFS transporter [Frateuria defendens]|uniref:MFS transporter n=1 Tax=Frateuria defendens TaxID=2219559 RepID=UPI001F335263|nr:MFS transporter [Frateuria defendens]
MKVVNEARIAGPVASLAAAGWATRAIFLVCGMVVSSWAPMVPYVKARLSLDDAELGLILLAFGGGSMVAMPLAGVLAQRRGYRAVIVGSGLLACLTLPLLALAPGVVALVPALTVFGAMVGTLGVAMNGHAVEVERRDGRGLMSGFHGLFSLGGLAGSAGMSALLAAGLPLAGCAVGVSLLLALLVLVARDHLFDEAEPAHERRAPFRLPRGLVWLLGLLCFASFMAEGSMLDWSALFLREERGFAPAVAGLGYACFSVAMAAGRFGGDWLVARVGPVWTVRAGAGLAALGYLLAIALPWPALALFGFVLVGLGGANVVPAMFSAVGRLPGTSPAISMATVTTLGYLGLLCGPALIGLLSHASNLRWALLAVAALLAVVAASARVVRR